MVTMVGETLFVDTNVLIIATDDTRLFHEDALRLLSNAATQGLHLATSNQVLREYLAVVTRPVAVNGLGLSIVEAVANLRELTQDFYVCDETGQVSSCLLQLALAYNLHGKRLHDTNLIATMQVYGIRSIVTQNEYDFGPFQDVAVMSIADVVSAF